MYGLRTKDFEDTSHQGKLKSATASTKEIYQKAKELLKEMYKEPIPIRLIGMRVDNLIEKNQKQISLFDSIDDKKQEKLDKAIDELKNKYGYDIVNRAGKMEIDKDIKMKDI